MTSEVRQAAFMPDGSLSSVPVEPKHTPKPSNQYPLFAIGTPIVPTIFIQEHLHDVIPCEIEIKVPGASYSLKGNQASVSKAMREVTR